ncbi:MAG: bifunctional diguanylate cyclase/phosphodiesterase [Candidatus Izemoplasmatales bacterium]|jgi:predicted signal transduction protein with EAL and GGDEF domain|nr:bifunctional diguanylate cyclase/phosphodiesterase [Candidatus Izemoplasmatales bacterium]
MKRKIAEIKPISTNNTTDLGFSSINPQQSGWDETINENNSLIKNDINMSKVDQKVDFESCDIDTLMDDIESKKNTKMVVRFNSAGIIDYASTKVLGIINLAKEDFIGKNINDFNSTLMIHNGTWYEDLKHDFHAQSLTETFIGNEKRWLLWDFEAIINSVASIDAVVATGHEITDFINQRTNSIQNKHKDYLTGLWNRQGLHEQLNLMENKIDQAVAFFIDCWSFSKIIDYYGHHVSDEVILLLGNELQKLNREVSLISRYSESQFVIVCINEFAHPNRIEKMLESLEKNLVSMYTIRDMNFQIDKRIGYSLYPNDTNDLSKLISFSSLAMKESIKLDQISVKRYQKYMSEILEQNVLYAQKLQNAINNNYIEVYFQKIINVVTNEVHSFEELARWNDPELGNVSPKTMFTIAKEANIIDKLEKYLVEKAIIAIKQVNQIWEYRHAKLALNITPASLLDPHFLAYLDGIVEEHDMTSDAISIEISESTFVNSIDLCVERINDFKQHGYSISIDDFGREYSSLAILEDVAFDIIKIDAVFINKIKQPKNQEIVKMIYKIAKFANQLIVAEGVETVYQRDILKRLGCIIQQGYFFNRPEKISAILDRAYDL